MPWLIAAVLGVGGFFAYRYLTSSSWAPLPPGTEMQPGQTYREQPSEFP
jgi:hypothetical protein